MKHVVTIAAAVALCGAGSAQAGIGRSDQSVGILFEPGNYAQFSLGGFNRNISGVGEADDEPFDDMSPGYGTYSLGYKQALSDRLDLAIILDQPIGVKVNYPGDIQSTRGGYLMDGSRARIRSNAVTGLLRYRLPQNLSVYGGPRIERTSGKIALNAGITYDDQPPPPDEYTLDTSTETNVGYVVGVAWENPGTGARVALSYNSKIDHDFTATEWGKAPTQLELQDEDQGHFSVKTDRFTTTIPESVNLEFQTGIARDTLLTGSVRWVHWTQFNIMPPAYSKAFVITHPDSGPAPLIYYKHNSTTWKIGLDHRFNDQWSGTVIFGYEPHEGTPTSPFDPTDGFKSVALAASYQASDRINITGDISYVDIGDAYADNDVEDNGGLFSGNSGFGVGLRVGIRF